MEGLMTNARQIPNEKLMAMPIYEAMEIDNPSKFMATPPDDHIADDENYSLYRPTIDGVFNLLSASKGLLRGLGHCNFLSAFLRMPSHRDN
jgi:hypothetical protein